MFIRTVSEPRANDELEQVRLDTFMKEFNASQNIFSEDQCFPWDIYLAQRGGIPQGVFYPHIKSIRNIIPNFSHALRRLHDLFPKVSRTKTVSRESAELYCQYYPNRSVFEITTKDLEVHYGRTGEHIQGKCEMRQAWKFNDLKPRFYYAQGGRDYFASRYIKKIAVALMDSLSTTSEVVRVYPDRMIEVEPEDFITFWDYTAFTTSLSELKYYLYFIARGLEDYGHRSIFLFDYHLGKVEADPVEMLDNYNQVVNQNSPFTIHRILDRFLYDISSSDFYQQNSGMLGVAGNIGFSTSCHGAVIASSVGPNKSVCVGDDGCGLDPNDPDSDLIPTIQSIGTIERSKFTTIPPFKPGPAKFLKRGTWRDIHTLFIDTLYPLPISVYIDGDYDPRRTVNENFTWEMRMKKTIISIGQLLWKIRDAYFESMEDDEYTYLLTWIRHIYSSLHLPYRGGCLVPSIVRKHEPNTRMLPLLVPDVTGNFDHRLEDWLEVLLDRRPEGLVIPDYVGFYRISRPIKGQKHFLPRTREIKALEDMEVVKMKTVHVEITYWNEDTKRHVKQFLKRFSISKDFFQLVEVEFLEDVPDRFMFLFDPIESLDYNGVIHDMGTE